MRYTLHPEAEDELVDVVEYYDSIEFRLGLEFAGEVYDCIQRIARFPMAWPVHSREIRRCYLKRFPYCILYLVREESIRVVAIEHVRQDSSRSEFRLD